MTRAARMAFAMFVILSTVVAAQQERRTASPGKYKFSGTLGGGSRVSGRFEVDVTGAMVLSDATCSVEPRPASSRESRGGGCSVGSVTVLRVKNANTVEVQVEVLVRGPGDPRAIGGTPGIRAYSGTMRARRK